jgi:hypothetical protein
MLLLAKTTTYKEAKMKRPRSGRCTKRECYHDQLLEAIGRYLPQRGLPLISGDGRVRWTDRLVVIVAILMSWCATALQQDAFEQARDATVSMYRSRRRPGGTLTGYLAAVVERSVRLLVIVARALRQANEQVGGRHWRMGPWVVMSVDGSRVECPRTAANEEAFGCAGKNKTTPQQFLTTVFHVATGLIWDWRRGRGDEAERNHLRQMLVGLPDRTMLVADAGFTGFDLLRSVLAGGHQFIVRVGSNVRLLRKLGYALEEHDGIVYLWPQGRRDEEPLTLRLVVVNNGRRAVYLLSSVLDEGLLSDREIARIYGLRWGIEVLYRSLKQTMGKRKMRSAAPEQARVELDWAMVGLWMLGLMTVQRISHDGHEPGQWSVAKALRAVRRSMQRLEVPTTGGGLFGQLRRAVKDRYERNGSKDARNWPRKKTEKPAGAPRIRMAKRSEIREVQRLFVTKGANSLVA